MPSCLRCIFPALARQTPPRQRTASDFFANYISSAIEAVVSTASMAKQPIARRFRFKGPILDALRQLGGSAKPKEVEAIVFPICGVGDEDLAVLNKNGGSNVRNQLHWARNSLKDDGLLDGSEKGVWRLTEQGTKTNLHVEHEAPLPPSTDVSLDHVCLGTSDEKTFGVSIVRSASLLETLMSLSANGFERLCQRLLREAGFDNVEVTGGSNDGGIDGHGVLRTNEFVSFRVAFQCKKYSGSVGPDKIRDFRGGLRAADTDKAILISTGTYTRSAREEAAKPGLFPIELVDGERLVELMERLGLGVSPRTVFDVNDRFFDEYR